MYWFVLKTGGAQVKSSLRICAVMMVEARFRTVILLSIILMVQGLIKGKSGYETKGVALLDAVTFPRVVPHNDIGVMLMIWNEEMKGDYGSDSMVEDYYNFAATAEFKGVSGNVLFAQLVVNNWANKNLSIQIDPSLEQYKFPRIYYFHPGNGRPVPYPQYTTPNQVALNRFLGTATTFYLGVPGTQKDMYLLAREFIAAAESSPPEMETVLMKTQKRVEELAPEMGGSWREFGYYYVRTMQKVINNGLEFVLKEITRLEDLVSDSTKRISIEKRNEMQSKVNILHNFVTLDVLGIKPNPASSYGKTEADDGLEEIVNDVKVGMAEL